MFAGLPVLNGKLFGMGKFSESLGIPLEVFVRSYFINSFVQRASFDIIENVLVRYLEATKCVGYSTECQGQRCMVTSIYMSMLVAKVV
jgi:hypothetical protein